MLKPIITPPTELPVTLAQVKAQAVVDFGDDDVLLDGYIRAATGYLDGPTGIMGRAIMPQTVMQQMSEFCNQMRLPYGPATSITSVTYYDQNNVMQAFTGWSLLEDESGPYLFFADDTEFPEVADRPEAVTVTYQAGYQTAAMVPPQVKHAIALLATTWYSTREDIADGMGSVNVPYGVAAMIAPLRRVDL